MLLFHELLDSKMSQSICFFIILPAGLYPGHMVRVILMSTEAKLNPCSYFSRKERATLFESSTFSLYFSDPRFVSSHNNQSIVSFTFNSFPDMNSSSIQLNNAAIEAIHAGNLAGGFNILLRACADQNRTSKNEHGDSHKRGHPSHSPSFQASKNTAYDHIFEYFFEDCSNLLLLPVAHDDGSTLAAMSLSRQHRLRLLNLKFLKINALLPAKQIDGICRCGVSWVLGYK